MRGKGGETREKPSGDLRARTDCFNRRIWLDESASEVGRPQRIFAAPLRWLAGLRGGVGSEEKGRRCRKSALLAKAARGGVGCAQKKRKEKKSQRSRFGQAHNARSTPNASDMSGPKTGRAAVSSRLGGPCPSGLAGLASNPWCIAQSMPDRQPSQKWNRRDRRDPTRESGHYGCQLASVD